MVKTQWFSPWDANVSEEILSLEGRILGPELFEITLTETNSKGPWK